MKGLEYAQIFGIIILIAVIIIVVLIVVNPSLSFGKSTEARTSFEEFCVFWSLNGYAEGYGEQVIRDNKCYGCPGGCGLSELCCGLPCHNYCDDIRITDIDTCRKCCKKEIAC